MIFLEHALTYTQPLIGQHEAILEEKKNIEEHKTGMVSRKGNKIWQFCHLRFS